MKQKLHSFKTEGVAGIPVKSLSGMPGISTSKYLLAPAVKEKGKEIDSEAKQKQKKIKQPTKPLDVHAVPLPARESCSLPACGPSTASNASRRPQSCGLQDRDKKQCVSAIMFWTDYIFPRCVQGSGPCPSDARPSRRTSLFLVSPPATLFSAIKLSILSRNAQQDTTRRHHKRGPRTLARYRWRMVPRLLAATAQIDVSNRNPSRFLHIQMCAQN